jgi:hypothetical protein
MVKKREKTKFMATMERRAAALVDCTARTKYWERMAFYHEREAAADGGDDEGLDAADFVEEVEADRAVYD